MGEEGGYSIFDFIQSLSPPTLSSQSPSDEAHIWTFWSKEDNKGMLPSSSLETLTDNWQIKDDIKSVLRSIIDWRYLYGPNFLVQFWAPTMTIGGQRLLTTTHQCFGLRRIERGLCEYRKHCMSLKFSTVFQDEEDDEFGGGDGGGVIGRVFRHKQMESTPDIEYYSVEEYPQRDFALKCGVRRSLAVPVFDPSGQTCVGVLELVDKGKYEIFPIGLYTVAKRISQILEDSIVRVPHEIHQVLNVVCKTHKLPLAQTWVPFRRTGAMGYSDDCYLSCSASSSLYQHGDDCDGDKLGEMEELSRICEYHHVRKGWGLVGKAFLSRNHYFCRDVTLLPIAEYPLSPYVCIYGLTGCFAICLQSTNGTGYHDCVLEFFLPPCNTISTDPRTFLESILATVNKHL